MNSTANTTRALVFRAGEYNVFGAYATSNINGTEYFDLEIGGEGGASYSDYSTACGCWYTGVEQAEEVSSATRKIIENGQVLILRDGVKYTLFGQPVK